MNSDEAERLVREMVEGSIFGSRYQGAVEALLEFHEQNKALIQDRYAEIKDIEEDRDLCAAEVERLQKVVADQALTIGVLKDEIGQLRTSHVSTLPAQLSWIALNAPAEVAAHAVSLFQGLLEAQSKYREGAETSRLALDVALKALKWFEEYEKLAELARVAHLTGGPEYGPEDLADFFNDLTNWLRENPKPGAAT